MWLKVNGKVRQNSSMANMVFDVATLLSYVSEFMSLLPGDVIGTGTPAWVGLGMNSPQYLKSGDVVELGIEGLGGIAATRRELLRTALFRDRVNRSCASTLTSISAVIHPIVTL